MVYITGYGLLSSLPEDEQALWHVLNHHDEYRVNAEKYPSYFCHPMVDYPVETQIPRHSDRRAMDKNMQAAVYVAGKALDMAGLKQDQNRIKDTDMIICFLGGARDEAVDQQIFNECIAQNNKDAVFNEMLMKKVRPTLFLGQLPNLLSANIAIVHGTTGHSLTLMGEEIASAQAVQIAYQRIISGKAKRVLVGGVCMSDTVDNLWSFNSEKLLLKDKFVPIWDRINGGVCLGAATGFLLLESGDSVLERNIRPLAKISAPLVTSKAVLPQDEEITVLTGLSGYPGHLQQELALWSKWQMQNLLWIRGLSTLTGAIFSAAFPSYLIFALQALQRQELFAPIKSELGIEQAYPKNRELNKIWVHCQGHLLGHALCSLERA